MGSPTEVFGCFRCRFSNGRGEGMVVRVYASSGARARHVAFVLAWLAAVGR